MAISFRVLGALVIVVAVLHLYATVLIRDYVLTRILDEGQRAFISPGYVLDHVLVGVLLLPIGFLMMWSAPALRTGQRWAYVVNLCFSLTFLTMPGLVVWIMAGPEFSSPAFSVATALICIVAGASCALLVWARKDFAAPAALGR